MLQRRGGSRVKVNTKLREMLEEGLQEDLIVTPELNNYMMQHDNLTIHPDVAKRISVLMSTPQRDRRFSFSASSAGYCLRRQELAFLGMPSRKEIIGPQTRMIFANGTWVHLRWQAILMSAGILDGVEVTVKHKKLKARCTLDGVGTAKRGRYEGKEFGFELKGRNDYDYTKQVKNDTPDDKTRVQVDFMFALTGFDVWSICNENKNNQMIKEWVFYRDEERIRDAFNEMEQLSNSIDRMKLHPLLPGCIQEGEEFEKCPFGGRGGSCQLAGTWPVKIPGSRRKSN